APSSRVSSELRGTVNLTMPLSAWLGWTQSPGDVPGYGPLDADDSRTLADLLSHGPGSRWCVTLTDPAGHPIAHACARLPPTDTPPPGAQPYPGDQPDPAPPDPARPEAVLIPGPRSRAGCA